MEEQPGMEQATANGAMNPMAAQGATTNGPNTTTTVEAQAADSSASLQLDATLSNTQEVPSETKEEKPSPVELIWQVPGEAVEVYHIFYGLNPSNLDREVVVEVSELEKYDHPSFGPVFRYYLTSAPDGKTIWVSLQAENKFGKSPRSEPRQLGETAAAQKRNDTKEETSTAPANQPAAAIEQNASAVEGS
ncbi:MAG: hypothetical protein KDD44_12020 [Bdellovibrionales bacterium]|nr:hypothetical protein [Bdellovibrionales bacterium]